MSFHEFYVNYAIISIFKGLYINFMTETSSEDFTEVVSCVQTAFTLLEHFIFVYDTMPIKTAFSLTPLSKRGLKMGFAPDKPRITRFSIK